MEIEQRIGRLHRLGQQYPVRIYNLVQAGSLQEQLLNILQEKLNLFELVVGETGLILGERFSSDEFAEEIFRRWRDSEDRVAEALLDRIDDYFENYERELQQRTARSRSPDAQFKLKQRLDAARAEHQRRRGDQLQRHEIRVIPHLDAVLMIAEPAWEAIVAWEGHHQARHVTARFLPRARRWFIDEAATRGAAQPPPNQTGNGLQ